MLEKPLRSPVKDSIELLLPLINSIAQKAGKRFSSSLAIVEDARSRTLDPSSSESPTSVGRAARSYRGAQRRRCSSSENKRYHD